MRDVPLHQIEILREGKVKEVERIWSVQLLQQGHQYMDA